MNDHSIIELFLNRDQAALTQAERQYGNACRAVADRILEDEQAADAVVREALFRAWETIPTKQPKNLKAHLLRITRNLAVDHAPQNGEYDRALRELDRCIQQADGLDAPCNAKTLRRAIDEFLRGLAPAKRRMFVLRYWYLCSAEEISDRCGISPSHVRTTLNQVRTQLREFLRQQELSCPSSVQLLRTFGNIRDEWIMEAQETKRSLPLWVKGAALGAAVCCAVALGVFFFSRWESPDEPEPPQTSTEATAPSGTSPIVSTTEPEPSTTAPTVESSAQSTETSEPTATEVSIRDTAAYQKLLYLENADQFDASVLEAFAQWIEDEDGFLEAYPEKWELKKNARGTFSLTCYTPLSEEYKRNFYSLHYDGEKVFFNSSGDRLYTSIHREEVAAKVYSAEDPIGVDDALKKEFVDFILDSDWFPWSTLNPEYRTQWYFAKETLSQTTENQTEYIQLFVKVWKPDAAESDYTICSLWYNGTKVMDGERDS